MVKRPNFLIVVADDLGFSDTGPYGSEIQTPCLDQLAREGLVMTGFHTASACSPTRAMLLSGTDNHIAGLGQMAEFMQHKPQFKGKPGYEGYLNFRVATAAEILQDAGYFTCLSGKWHLGLTKETAPCARGFDQNFTYLAGCGNHFNNEIQLDNEKFRPPALDGTGLWMEGDVFLDRKKDIPKDFYSTTYFTDKMLGILQNRDAETREKPFLAYLAYTAPHWPLQVPQADLPKYRGQYNDGPEALRERRLQGLIQRGLIAADVAPAPMIGPETPEWEQKSEEERMSSSRRMEVYASMVHLIDAQLQRVIDYLRSTDELDNTFIVFMSDNGAEGKELEALPILSGSPLSRVVAKYYNNSLDNIGNSDSFVWYGARWAAAATAPSKGFKTYTFEGGIRCPCIVRYPALARSSNGSITHEFATCMDILPTMLQLAEVAHPHPTFHGRDVAAPRGRSWVPYLSRETEMIHDRTSHVTGWELFGRRAIRRGDFKAVFTPAPAGSDEWELYDISKDPGEVNNLAANKPDTLEQLLRDWTQYVEETGMYDIKLSLSANPHADLPKEPAA